MTYELAGDEIYVDAHILKWKPMANMLGLHTAYELDRVAGRYDDIAWSGPRTGRCIRWSRIDRWIFLGSGSGYAFLAPLLDAEYGSGTFVPVGGAQIRGSRLHDTGCSSEKTSQSQSHDASERICPHS